MSFFYLCPVKGDLPSHLLETIVFKRIDFLNSLINKEPVAFNEYLIEGSVYDNVGHFTLCLILVMCDNRSLKSYFAKAESCLFKNRLAALSSYELRLFAKKLVKTLKKFDSIPDFLEPLYVLSQKLLLKHVAQHLSNVFHCDDCQKYSINLKFRHCLSLVGKRTVELSNGLAKLPCSQWKQYLCSLYDRSFHARLLRADIEALKSDPRITELINKVKQEKFDAALHLNINSSLTSNCIDRVSIDFPPCMWNLHKTLRDKHRLSHDQRFIYSLFLKDIGLPVEEAIEFWKKEYHMTPKGKHPCNHSWEKDEKKYLYGIRHMYGLEGARKSYTSVNCSRIQCSTNAGSEGGCPFKSFDFPKMLQVLNRNEINVENISSQILDFKIKKQFTSACVMYLVTSKTNVIINRNSDLSFNLTPVKYYDISSKNQ